MKLLFPCVLGPLIALFLSSCATTSQPTNAADQARMSKAEHIADQIDARMNR